jgi:hypothetical protein
MDISRPPIKRVDSSGGENSSRAAAHLERLAGRNSRPPAGGKTNAAGE